VEGLKVWDWRVGGMGLGRFQQGGCETWRARLGCVKESEAVGATSQVGQPVKITRRDVDKEQWIGVIWRKPCTSDLISGMAACRDMPTQP